MFKPLDRYFKKIKIFEINRPFIWPFSFKIIDILSEIFVFKWQPLIIQGIDSKFHIFVHNNS